MKHTKEHPGFKAIEKKISGKVDNPGAVIASAARNASKSAKKANPNLKKVKG